MPKWIVTCIIVLIFSFIMVPIEKWIYRKISTKWLAYIATAAIAASILLGMYYFASLTGLGPYDLK